MYNGGTKRGEWSVPLPGFFPLGKTPGSHCVEDWLGPRFMKKIKSVVRTGFQTPNHPALCNLLYQLCSSGPSHCYCSGLVTFS